MHGIELKRIRQNLGMDRVQFARLIGYTGTDRNNETRLRSYENGKLQVPLYIARFVWLIDRYRDHTGILPQFPRWPGYEFESKPDPQKEPIDG
jgi:hypothetical protein